MSDWEIESGGQPQGPFSEASLIASIERGLPATTLVRRVGTLEWLPIGTHPPFAVALVSVTRPEPAPPQPPIIVMQAPAERGGCSRVADLSCGLVLLIVALPFLALVVGGLAKGCAGH